MSRYMAPLDWRGVPITVGSTVVYPGRQGSSHWMNEAEVNAITYEDSWRGPSTVTVLHVRRTRCSWATASGTSKLRRIDRVTVVAPAAEVTR